MRRIALLLLVAGLAACASKPKIHTDPFFTQSLSSTRMPDAGETGPLETAAGYEIEFRVLECGEGRAATSEPTLAILPGRLASVSLVSQVSYVKTFEIEHTDDAWLADPVIATLLEGLTLEVVASAADNPAHVVLAWHVTRSDPCGPMETRDIRVGDGKQPVTIQLPAWTRVDAAGRSRLRLGEETRLGRMPIWLGQDGPSWLTLTALARPAAVPAPAVAEAEPPLPASVEPILRDRRAPPSDTPPLEIAVVTLTGDPGPETLQLSDSAADRVLRSLGERSVRKFVLDAATEPGLRIAYLQKRGYVRDYDIIVGENTGALIDPIVDRITVGFEAAIEDRDGTPTLVWTYRTLAPLLTFTTYKAVIPEHGAVRVPIEIDLPEVTETSGELPLTSPVGLERIGKNGEGLWMAVLVRRLGP